MSRVVALLSSALLLLMLSPPQNTSAQPAQRADRLGLAHVSAPQGITDELRYQQAADLGARWNRFPIYWDRVEPNPSAFDWEKYDRQVIDDIAYDFNILAVLIGRPGFAVDGGSIRGLYEPVFQDGTDNPGADKPLNPANPWVMYVDAVVRRYKPDGGLAQVGLVPPGRGITAWEIWNEPDFSAFWSGGIEDYARLLKISYLTIKRADSNAQVMFGGLLYNTPDNWLARVLAIYSSDPQATINNYYMDTVAVHSYADPLRTGWLVRYARDTLRQYGLSRFIWVTEMGVPVWDDYPGPTWAAVTDERVLRSTARQQAYFVIQSAVDAWHEGADVLIVHQLYDDCGDQPAGTDFPPHNGELCTGGNLCFGDAHGLLRNRSGAACFSQHPQPGTARPAARAYRLVADVFSEAFTLGPAIEEGSLIPDAARVYRFTRTATGERITVMWNMALEAVSVQFPAVGDNAQLLGLDVAMVVDPINGFYQFDLPAALPDKHPSPQDGTDVAIGGAPFILIERPGGRFDAPQVMQVTDAPPTPIAATLRPTRTPASMPTADPDTDTTPPDVSVLSLPVVSPPSFTVSWQGRDNSGIDYYLIWVRVDSGEWSLWLETPDTSATYQGEVGRRYEFAAWAVDLAGNWSTNVELFPQASTGVE